MDEAENLFDKLKVETLNKLVSDLKAIRLPKDNRQGPSWGGWNEALSYMLTYELVQTPEEKTGLAAAEAIYATSFEDSLLKETPKDLHFEFWDKYDAALQSAIRYYFRNYTEKEFSIDIEATPAEDAYIRLKTAKLKSMPWSSLPMPCGTYILKDISIMGPADFELTIYSDRMKLQLWGGCPDKTKEKVRNVIAKYATKTGAPLEDKTLPLPIDN
jgi:hypothetical protein